MRGANREAQVAIDPRHLGHGAGAVSDSSTWGMGVPPALGRRIDEACDRFEAAWRGGLPPRLEEFVAGWAGDERAALLRELVPLDADYRRRRGEEVRPADYTARLPGLDPTWLADVVAE